MTNFERIKNMTVEEMAERNVQHKNYNGQGYMSEEYRCSDGEFFSTYWEDDAKDKAIQHEMNWLNSESEE